MGLGRLFLCLQDPFAGLCGNNWWDHCLAMRSKYAHAINAITVLSFFPMFKWWIFFNFRSSKMPQHHVIIRTFNMYHWQLIYWENTAFGQPYEYELTMCSTLQIPHRLSLLRTGLLDLFINSFVCLFLVTLCRIFGVIWAQDTLESIRLYHLQPPCWLLWSPPSRFKLFHSLLAQP